MKTSFEYWINHKDSAFFACYWMLFSVVYSCLIWLAIKTRNSLIFILPGIIPYFVIAFYRAMHNPFRTLEEDIKKYDYMLSERFAQNVPEKYRDDTKKRSAYLFTFLCREPEGTLNPDVLLFKKRYARINSVAMISAFLWFVSVFVLTIYVHVNQ